MAAATKGKPAPRWVIDTHGMREALTTPSNSTRAAVIAAIENGTMLILKPVSDEIKKLFPELWDDFKAIANKKYHSISVQAICAAGALTESYGSSILGSIPTKEHFQAVAAARLAKCNLISSAKALAHCQAIAKKCKLPDNTTMSLAAFSNNS